MSRDSIKTKTVMLIMTEDCNLSCTYCYEHIKTNHYMSFETAAAILDRELSDISGYEEVVVEFFGGEPLLAFDTIKQVFQYIQENYAQLPIMCYTTTNGTLLTDAQKEWFYQHRDRFICGLSVDGTPNMHNLNRNNSFDSIDLDFFAGTWPFQKCKMTISPLTIHEIDKGIIYLHQRGFRVGASFAQGMQWNMEKDVPALENALERLVSFYMDNPHLPLTSLLDIRLYGIYNDSTDYRWCGAGKHLRAYDVDGNVYPCQSFIYYSKLNNVPKYDPDNINIGFGTTQDPMCADCVIERICSTCYGINQEIRGHLSLRDKSLCVFNKLCIMASAKIQFHRIMANHPDGTGLSETDYLTLSAIRKINENLT